MNNARLFPLLVLVSLVFPTGIRAQTVETGPYAVGFRVLETTDYSRAIGPKQDYTGAALPGNAALPLPVSLWYPAQADAGEPMTYGTYLAMAQTHKRGSFGPITDADREAATNLPNGIAQFAYADPLTDAELAAIMDQPATARRDAKPAPGAFPLILTSLYGTQSANLLAEHLASHGYVVVTIPMRPEIIRQQVTTPQFAIETQSRNLEFALAQVRSLPFVDTSQMGLLGLNFDGFAVLNVQMRNMQADAVVSLDGWQDKHNGTETMRASPYFDVLHMRVPYLAMTQANPPQENYAPNFAIFDALQYAERYFYLVRDFEHHHFIGDLLAWPHLRAEVEPAYAFVYSTVRHFFDAYVKKDGEALAWLQQPPAEKGFAANLIEQTRRAPALPPVPTRERFALLLENDLTEAVRVLRAARADNPDVDLVSMQTLNLMAFRARRRDDVDDVAVLNQLKTEIFPTSTQAFYDLGTVLSEMGRVAEAVAAFQHALALLIDDPDVSAEERETSRQQIQARLDEATSALPSPLQLTHNDHADFHPSWSPDGLSILYDTIHGEQPVVALVPANGGTPNVLAQGDHPLWFSDSQRFLYVSEQHHRAGIYAMHVADRQPRRLVEGPGYAVPSPDARRAAYLSNQDGDWDLFTLDLETESEQPITENDASDFAPAWSPDGGSLLFMSQQDGNWNVYLAHLEDRSVIPLTNHPADDTAPQWSPDGSWIAFFSDRTGATELYLMRPDGSDIRQLTRNRARDWMAWSPDGTRIAFVAGDEGEDLYVIDVQTETIIPLVIRPGRDVAPSWSPDGQRLVFASDHDGDLDLYIVSLPR